jgi:hypothetical protein
MAVTFVVDPESRGEVARYLERLLAKGQVKKCINLRLDRAPEYYHPKCEKDYASLERATNVPRFSYYKWPKCPEKCPYFVESLDFPRTVSRDQYDELQRGDIRGPDPSVTPGVIIEVETPAPRATRKPPAVLPPAPAEASPKPLEVPEKVTLAWMYHKVHWTVWGTIGVLLVAAFVLGSEVGPIVWLENLLKRMGWFH